MKLKCVWIIFLSLFSTGVFALLAPYYQSSREINAILVDPAVVEKMGSNRIIQSVTKTEIGYILTTIDGCSLEISIENLSTPTGMVGPMQFRIIPKEMVCNMPEKADLEKSAS